MAFRTITAKYPATCRRCGGHIRPGERIRHGGRGLTYHLASDCGGRDGAGDGPRAYASEQTAAFRANEADLDNCPY